MNSFDFWNFKLFSQKLLVPSTKREVVNAKPTVFNTTDWVIYSLTILALWLFTTSLSSSLAQTQNLLTPETQKFHKAIEAYNQGRFEKASEELQRLAEASSVSSTLEIKIKYYWTRSQIALDSTNIESHFEDFILRYPGSAESGTLLIELGHHKIRMEKYSEAVRHYQDALDSGLDYNMAAQVHYWKAETLAEAGDYDGSRKEFLLLADSFPSSEWSAKALYARGRLFLSEDKYDSTSTAFELLKKRYPNDPVTRGVGTALGESYYQQGRYEDAIKALDAQMIFLDDISIIKALFLMAEAHNYLGNYDEAIKDYLRYLNLTKGTEREAPAHYGLGWLYHHQGIYHWAAQSFERAIIGDDLQSRKALYYEAVNHKLSGNFQRAMDTFKEFGNRYKEGMWVEQAYYEWGISAFEAGNYDGAITILLNLISQQDSLSNGAQIYTLLGEIFYANNEYTSSITAFEQAETMGNVDPGLRRQAQFQKAWVLHRNQAFEQAQPLFESVYAEAPRAKLGAEALFWSADSYYKLDQFGEASNRFKTFTEYFPTHKMMGAALYSLGWCYFKLGNFEAAVQPLETFLEKYEAPPIALFPYDTDTQLRIGDAYYALGQYRKSIEFYNKAIGAEPGGDYAMFQVANSYYRANRTFEAVSTFRRLLRIYPFSRLREQAQYNVAYIYMTTGNNQQAIEEFETVINRYPGTEWAARAQYNIGDAHYNTGKYELAIEAYQQVLNRYPRSSYIIQAINGIQYAQLSSGKMDSSSVILEEFLSDNPQSNTADRLRFRQAENTFQSGDYPTAIREFRQYLRVTNSDQLIPQVYANLGESYKQIGDENRAIEAYELILSDFPQSNQAPGALTSLGLLYFEKAEYEASNGYFNRLLTISNRFQQEAYVGMGNAKLGQSNFVEAKDQFEAALQINPNNANAQLGLAKVTFGQSNYTEARDLLFVIADRNTTELGAESQYLLGVIRKMEGNSTLALEEFAKVTVLFEAFDEWVSAALYDAAIIHLNLGNTGEAFSMLNEIIERYPDSPVGQAALTLIEQQNL